MKRKERRGSEEKCLTENSAFVECFWILLKA